MFYFPGSDWPPTMDRWQASWNYNVGFSLLFASSFWGTCSQRGQGYSTQVPLQTPRILFFWYVWKLLFPILLFPTDNGELMAFLTVCRKGSRQFAGIFLSRLLVQTGFKTTLDEAIKMDQQNGQYTHQLEKNISINARAF